VISILGETLQPLDEDGLIPAYGFGDVRTQGHSIFPLKVYVSTCLFIDGRTREFSLVFSKMNTARTKSLGTTSVTL